MKKFILLVIFISTFLPGKAQENSLPEITKSHLQNFIAEATKEGKISEEALIVLDEETIIDLEEMKEDQKYFGKILLIEKGNEEMTQLYGEKAKNGIIMIQSLPKTPEGKDIQDTGEKVLYFIGGKEVSEKFLQKINRDSVRSVRVIKSKEEIARYTDKECDGIIVIDAAIRY